MNLDELYSELTLKIKTKVALIVLDGLGDIATKEQNYLTPLEAAVTPNLDKIAKDSAQGRMIPAAPGITPGSGPGHLRGGQGHRERTTEDHAAVRPAVGNRQLRALADRAVPEGPGAVRARGARPGTARHAARRRLTREARRPYSGRR